MLLSPGWNGVKHLDNWDSFDEVIKQAQTMPGFTADAPKNSTTTGFARNAVLGIADKVRGATTTFSTEVLFFVAFDRTPCNESKSFFAPDYRCYQFG